MLEQQADVSAELALLARLVLHPILPHLPEGAPLTLVPHAPLAIVPFAALPLPDGDATLTLTLTLTLTITLTLTLTLTLTRTLTRTTWPRQALSPTRPTRRRCAWLGLG